ncbi:hypothetical protein DPMN_002830 [Dreissena polymorpha]|uniref:Uncharacterized protein n=1 Tax=Dreissena polymorpha TaxID=45954 RepID=A0A9D4MN25_DREPO|nr:hypothetical protein DPMN_002830 [Dreissena polymorpha]
MARQRPTRVRHAEIDCIVIREVQYQLKLNQCKNEEAIVKGNFGWVWPMWAGRLRIDRIVKKEVHKGNFGWVWPMWAGPPKIDRIVIREVHYQFEVNRCRNEEIIGAPGLVMAPCIVQIDHIVIREVQYQFAF